MNSLGIYFGIKEILLVETSGKKIVNNIRLPHPDSVMAELEEKVPADIKLMAMLKDAFRTNRISAEEAFFSLSGQDLVVRTFEIPVLPKGELKGAINFEVKRYIPFKLEELDYDFQVLTKSKEKTSSVLFVGIKKDIFSKYISIAKQLNLKLGMIEYSAFSILRFLKLAGLNDAGVVATLCFDLNNEDEVNFSVFENGFSLFSRDFILAAEPGGFEQTVEADLGLKREKLKNEIKVSLDYYNRKFPEKIIKNIFTLSGAEGLKELSVIFTEFSIPFKIVETQKVLGKGAVFSSALAKGFAASLSKIAPLKLKIDLVSARVNQAKAVTQESKPVAALWEGLTLNFNFIILGFVLCVIVLGYGIFRTGPMKEELAEIKSRRVKISSVISGDSLDTFSALGEKYRKKIHSLDKLVKDQMYATYPLNAVPAALPDGVWLISFNFAQKKSGAIELSLEGQAYLKNSDKEFEAVSVFLENLKKEPEFSKYFKEINIVSIDQKPVGEETVTIFSVVCKNLAENK